MHVGFDRVNQNAAHLLNGIDMAVHRNMRRLTSTGILRFDFTCN